MEKMDKMRDSVLEIRSQFQNYRGQPFIPDGLIEEIVTQETVYEILHETVSFRYGKPDELHYKISDAVQIITNGAQKAFAILVYMQRPELIYEFIKHDNYQSSQLDHKLPLDMERLKMILLEGKRAEEFFEEQWRFAIPVFSDSVLPRILPGKTILPFLEQQTLGSGSFGEVYTVIVPPSHQRFGAGYERALVRKEFISLSQHRSSYMNELHNLALLKHLHHPNVIELLSAYTFDGKHNLIFPQAEGGDLGTLLAGPCPKAFGSDQVFLNAISGLCSAVRAVHHYVSKQNMLALIGCHHDLKPANVLVNSTNFLLSDFGLSKFKETSKSSATSWKVVHPYYSPPESEKQGGRTERPMVRRSGDIWSLGCMISEIVTYMYSGADGVKEFDEQREEAPFHLNGQPNPGVNKWIEQHVESASGTNKMLGLLVQRMLQIDEALRPSAQEAEEYMKFIAMDAICASIQRAFRSSKGVRNSVTLTLEQTRFDSWLEACQLLEEDRYTRLYEWHEGMAFRSTCEILERIHSELEADQIGSGLSTTLNLLNDHLIDSLSPKCQLQADHYLRSKMLLDLEKAKELSKIHKDNPTLALNRTLGMLATIKCMNEVTGALPTHVKSLDYSRLKTVKRIGEFKLCYLEGERVNHFVVVESKLYHAAQAEKDTAMELQRRLEEIVATLQEAVETDQFRILRCLGFYHDIPAYTCGLVYEIPIPTEDSGIRTLREILETTYKSLEQRPSLEQRVGLAQALVNSLLGFHTVSWVQRLISSYHIIFSLRRSETSLEGIENPFFLGFLHSRKNDTTALTLGPPKDPHLLDYQHPEYCKDRARYRVEYDYYSLGLVLLEIGIWKDLGSILKSLHKSQSDSTKLSLLDNLLRRVVPRLRVEMGTKYQRVVETCLRGDFGVPDGLKDGEQQSVLLQSVSRRVVEPLETLRI